MENRYAMAFMEMDWDKYKILKKEMAAMDIECEKFKNDQGSQIILDTMFVDVIYVLLDMGIIDKADFDELEEEPVNYIILT